ncbi:MAG: 50S ribosomal protein L24 [Clostridia bacterium]|nr:50S ribosomal protein L24 [Clostridia bacterium]
MEKLHIKKDDTVVVISGDSKGVKGKVIAASPEEGKVIVEGANIVSKHTKARRQGDKSQIVKTEGAIYASKVQLYCPKCNKGVRVKHVISYVEKDGKNKKVVTRLCTKCGAEI